MRGGPQALGLAVLLTALPAYAIPSPDLVINAFASLAQIAGLLAAMSGAALLRFQRGRSGGGLYARHWLAALGIVAVLAVLANVWQHVSRLSADNRRLETNLWRKAADWDRPLMAPTISSAELAERMAQHQPLHLIDVREPEEFEVTHLPGARNMRYADLLLGTQSMPHDGVPVVFVCDSGKRSGEVCEQQTRQGQPCQVLEGGYPQWVREKRALSTPTSRWRVRFQSLPPYSMDTVYLDTPEVSTLVAADGARFVDVRSPAEFAHDHLPGAINLPMRGMASDALEKALSELPRQPFVAACYDNRSCFHARVLGLKLTRLGMDFRGRYTVPQEFPTPVQIAQRGMWARVQRVASRAIDQAVDPMARLLDGAADRLGGLVPATLLLLLLTRLALAPLGARLQAHRAAAQTIAAQTLQLREHYGEDDFRRQRAVQQLRRTSLQPWRSLLISLLQMGVFLVCFSTVRAAAQWSDEAFLWLPLLREPDPLHLLPVAIAVTTFVLTWTLLAAAVPQRLLRGAVVSGAAGLMGWLGWALSGAINVYLLASLVLLWVQQHPWRGRLALLRRGRQKVHASALLSSQPLSLQQCCDAGAVGGKPIGRGRCCGQACQCLPRGCCPRRRCTRLSPRAAAMTCVRRWPLWGSKRRRCMRCAVPPLERMGLSTASPGYSKASFKSPMGSCQVLLSAYGNRMRRRGRGPMRLAVRTRAG